MIRRHGGWHYQTLLAELSPQPLPDALMGHHSSADDKVISLSLVVVVVESIHYQIIK